MIRVTLLNQCGASDCTLFGLCQVVLVTPSSKSKHLGWLRGFAANGNLGALVGALCLSVVVILNCSSDASKSAEPTGGAGTSSNAGSGGSGAESSSAGAGGTGGTDETFRVVIMADTHVIGPQYKCCSESPGVDNASIIKTVDRLNAVRKTVNAIEPKPKFVFILGDVTHNSHYSQDINWYHENPTAFSVAADILKGFDMPVYPVLGNHDYGVDCDKVDDYPRDLTHQIFKDFYNAPPYQVVDYGGFKFLLTNGQLGPTWDSSSSECDNSYASYGKEQMQWIDDQLNEGKPTIVMSHYMRFLHYTKEEGPATSLPLLLDSHKNVLAFLAGHTHRWLDFTQLNYGVMHQVVAATRYDEDNFWLFEFNTKKGTFNILDKDKQLTGSSCANTWSYGKNTPAPVADAVETGDCVVGTE